MLKYSFLFASINLICVYLCIQFKTDTKWKLEKLKKIL